MKNLLIAILAITSIVLSSCSNKFSVNKRKYNKGFHIALSGTPKTLKKNSESNCVVAEKAKKESSTHMPKPLMVLTKESFAETNLNPSHEIISPVIQNKIISYKSHIISVNSELSASKLNLNPQVKPIFKPITHLSKENTPSKKPESSETKLIICVILAIFIPPLGMYLWKKDTDIWFILDLILFLFTFSLFFWGPFGSVGLAAIVIALLRVFDML
jgi:uncharacterized membrane protein YqaE (UPF0057 family)